jgi:hypothetical protein
MAWWRAGVLERSDSRGAAGRPMPGLDIPRLSRGDADVNAASYAQAGGVCTHQPAPCATVGAIWVEPTEWLC